MRINKYVALATGMSRRAADKAIKSGDVLINEAPAQLGGEVEPKDKVSFKNEILKINHKSTIIMMNKPVGYVCSRIGQGSKTIYDLLPGKYHHLKPVGRLDKDSSGLILLTNDGDLANQLTHPRYQKEKVYKARLDKSLAQADKKKLLTGVKLEDGLSKFVQIKEYSNGDLEVTLTEGRNRQIRRTFTKLNYTVIGLYRTRFGPYQLKNLSEGNYKLIDPTLPAQ